MDITKKIYWLMCAGVDFFCKETPRQSVVETQTSMPTATNDVPATQQAVLYAVKATDLTSLNAEKTAFSLSSLKKTAAHTLLGIGTRQPDLMCIIETPDSDADKNGVSFSGPQGELLHKMLAAIQLKIGENAYATYFSPWHTPGNRALTVTEKALFLPFLKQEILFVKPKKILIFGYGPAAALLGLDSPSKARNVWHEWNGIPVRVTLSINMVKTHAQRQQAWDDLQEVAKKV